MQFIQTVNVQKQAKFDPRHVSTHSLSNNSNNTTQTNLMQGEVPAQNQSILNNDISMLTNQHTEAQVVINLQDQQLIILEDPPLKANLNCHFGTFTLSLQQNMLTIELQLKQVQNSSVLQDDEIQMIQREEYQMTQPIQLNLINRQLSPSIKQSFHNIRTLAQYLLQNIHLPSVITVETQKLSINVKTTEGIKTVDLYYNAYKKIDKEQLIRDMRNIKNTFSMIKDTDMHLIDPDLLTTAVALTNEELLDLYRQGESSSSFSDDEDQSKEQSNEGDTESQKLANQFQNSSIKNDFPFNHHIDMKSQGQIDNLEARMNSFRKQNQIPIYQRFKGIDINLPRKQKIKLAQKMLRIGYSKEDIIRFFGGGAEEMELEGRRVPDYRNPNSLRYKEIHIIVAKKQHERFSKLLKKHGLPPVQELPEYSGEMFRNNQKNIRDLLFKFIKERRFRKLDEIQAEMKKRGIQCSLISLKKMIEDLKRRNQERKQSQEQSKTVHMQQDNLSNHKGGQSNEPDK